MDIKQWVIDLRRDFHQHPELPEQESRTATRVEEILSSLGIATRRAYNTGVIGVLEGAAPGQTIALRADMDALQLEERTQASYASCTAGVMHACGHDAHTAALLGAARLLASQRDELAGRVVFVFQPAEELGTGAAGMIQEGALTGVDAIMGQHVFSSIPVGMVATAPGPILAGSARFKATFRGKGGHGAMPHGAVDSIAPACQAVLALPSAVTKEFDAKERLVLTVGQIHGGTRANIVAGETWFDGTARFFEPQLGTAIEAKMRRIIEGSAATFGVTAELAYATTVPPTVNDAALTELVRSVAADLLGAGSLVPLAPVMGSEDFSYFAQAVPGVFVGIGAGNPQRGLVHPSHHPEFDIDEGCLDVMTRLFVGFARAYLAR